MSELIASWIECPKEEVLQKIDPARRMSSAILFISFEFAIFPQQGLLANKLRVAKQNCFENANKMEKGLAYRLKKEKMKTYIQALKGEEGNKSQIQKKLLKGSMRSFMQKKEFLLLIK